MEGAYLKFPNSLLDMIVLWIASESLHYFQDLLYVQ